MFALLLLTSLVNSIPLAQQGVNDHPKGSVHQNHAVEQAEYQVIQGGAGSGYEKRHYPMAQWVCTNMTVDTAGDPLAGLEDMDIFEIRKSDRYKTKAPSSIMFSRLFSYLRGKNKGGVQLAMTRGGSIKHTIVKKDSQGDTEKQERCLYLAKKYQGASNPAPFPLDPEVYIQERKEQNVFVKEFPGWVFTAASWQQSHKEFLEELHNKEQVPDSIYYTRNSGYHWVAETERHHDVWIPEI